MISRVYPEYELQIRPTDNFPTTWVVTLVEYIADNDDPGKTGTILECTANSIMDLVGLVKKLIKNKESLSPDITEGVEK